LRRRRRKEERRRKKKDEEEIECFKCVSPNGIALRIKTKLDSRVDHPRGA
jgi:hypothetical protein